MHAETNSIALPDTRLHGLDAVRATALLLGVVVHASMAWVPNAQAFWIVHDSSQSPAMSLAFYVPHMFRMLVFFLLAGFFARMSCERLGTAGFVRNRLKRIALPLLIFWFPVLASIIAVVVWNAWLSNGGKMPPAPPTPPMSPGNFPLTHLWFLYVLLLCYAVALAIRALLSRSALATRSGDAVARIASGAIGPFLLAAPLCCALFLTDAWRAWIGIPTPDQSLYPNPAACVAFGSAFGFGWLLHRQPPRMQDWAARWPQHLALALACTIACLFLVGLSPTIAPAPKDARTLLYAACYALGAWQWTFAVIGLGLRFFSGDNRALRYLADSSYWIYIVHLPLVMALQVAFSRVGWPWFVEFPLASLATLAIALSSYALLVRYGFIGRMLNGKRER